MLKFDASLLSLEIVLLKSVTTSLGGSISVIDEEQSSDNKEVLKRIEVPLSVARSFLVATRKMTRYLKPVHVAVIRYGDSVVCLERHPLAALGAAAVEDADGNIEQWKPACWATLQLKVVSITRQSGLTWYFDGRYVYRYESEDPSTSVRHATYLSSDGRFRKVVAQTLDLQKLADSAFNNDGKDPLSVQERNCLAFVPVSGQGMISPPIWKNLSALGASAITADRRGGDDDDDDEADVPEIKFPFDTIDESLAVNLNFALKAGNEIGRMFGYELVEPLQLPRLMIELHTVNLPNIPKEVKATYDVNINFTHAVAWLMGLSRRANNLETHVMMRSLLKYLSKRGTFRKNAFDASRVFVGEFTASTVPKIDLADLRKEQSDLINQPFGFSELLRRTRTGIARRKELSDASSLMSDMQHGDDE